MSADVLANPAWHALAGEQESFAEVRGSARRYRPSVSAFAAVPDGADDQCWSDLATLIAAAPHAVLTGPEVAVPSGWEEVFRVPGVQMVDEGVQGVACPEAVALTPADAADMLDLVRRTEPGPFEAQTVELGTYLGIRREGRLIAMAGERMRPPGYVEVSAVCTDAEFRGQGLAAKLVRAVVHGINARGGTAILHARSTNTNALRLYEQLGFATRRETAFVGVRAPDAV